MFFCRICCSLHVLVEGKFSINVAAYSLSATLISVSPRGCLRKSLSPTRVQHSCPSAASCGVFCLAVFGSKCISFSLLTASPLTLSPGQVKARSSFMAAPRTVPQDCPEPCCVDWSQQALWKDWAGVSTRVACPEELLGLLSWDQIRGCLWSPETEAHVSTSLLPSSSPQAPPFSPAFLLLSSPHQPSSLISLGSYRMLYAYLPDFNLAQYI